MKVFVRVKGVVSVRVEFYDHSKVALIPPGDPSSDHFTFTAVIKVDLVAENKQIFFVVQRVTRLTDFDKISTK